MITIKTENKYFNNFFKKENILFFQQTKNILFFRFKNFSKNKNQILDYFDFSDVNILLIKKKNNITELKIFL